MKKFTYTIIALLFFTAAAIAQSRYVFIDFKDVKKPGIQNEYTYPDKTVSDAIEEKMKKMGYRGNNTKGYTVYKGVVTPELGNQSYDLYFKIDRKSRKEKDNTIVNMLISTGNENFISDTSNSATINNAKTFLDNLMPAVAAYDLQQQVNAQGEALAKAEKKYKNLQDDAEDLQKRRKRIEEQIEENVKDQKNQQSEIEKQRQLLEALRARQK